jgi:hypothetical protein
MSAVPGVVVQGDGSVQGDGWILEGGAGAPAIDGSLAAVSAGLSLSCVSSGSLDGCSCRSRIAKDTVARAWARELEAGGDREARFFHFISDGGVWMAYGLTDGDVRGVYCPAHNSQRAERSRAASCCAGEVVLELPLAA